MLILLDLDGTLINTVHPGWKPYKDGQQDYPVAQIPLIAGAREFIASRKQKGDSLVIVSDSHPRYVNPIAEMLGVEALSLTDKPNTNKLKGFFDSHPQYKQMNEEGNCMVVGDTKLDIELGRRIGALTCWILPYQISKEIMDERDGIGDEMASKKMGPTYTVKTFAELERILDSPQNNLYSIEASFAGGQSLNAVRFSDNRYMDGTYACILCLARQEQGACDKYARADKYYLMSNPSRTEDFLQSLANGISSYINQPAVMNQGWDYFTYLTDKASTVPANKMKAIFDLVSTSIPKCELLKWSDSTQGSLRNRNLYNERRAFLEQFLTVSLPMEKVIDLFGEESERPLSVQGRNIIVLDDQLTTGATAWHVIHKLKERGAKNILFIAMFQMVLAVNNNSVICPRCGKPMLMKIRRSDGHRFYSCTPPEYRGNGCGFIIDPDLEISKKYFSILQKYSWGAERYIADRRNVSNIMNLVVEKEDDIRLINEMGMYKTRTTEEEIKRMRLLEQEYFRKIENNPSVRGWSEYVYLHYDYYDSYGYSIEYALQHLEEIELFTQNMKINEN